MQYIKQDTSVQVILGPFVDDTDGKTPRTDLTIAQSDIRLSKNGAAFEASASIGTPEHDENGYYRVWLDADDADALGRLVVAVLIPGALPVWQEYMVCAANMWDAFFGTETFTVDAADIWTYANRSLTMTAAAVTAAVAGKSLTLINKVGFEATITGVVIPANWEKVYVTVKANKDLADTAAVIQLVVSNGGDAADGLIRFLGNAPTVAQQGYGILVVDRPNNQISITLKDDLIFPAARRGRYTYDIKCLRTGEESMLLAGSGNFDILGTETEAIV